MPTFIFQRITPRRVSFIPAKKVQGTGGRSYSWSALRRSEETLNFIQVQSALSKCMKSREASEDLLERAFEDAKCLYPQLMGSASFSPRQSNGRPPLVIIKD